LKNGDQIRDNGHEVQVNNDNSLKPGTGMKNESDPSAEMQKEVSENDFPQQEDENSDCMREKDVKTSSQEADLPEDPEPVDSRQEQGPSAEAGHGELQTSVMSLPGSDNKVNGSRLKFGDRKNQKCAKPLQEVDDNGGKMACQMNKKSREANFTSSVNLSGFKSVIAEADCMNFLCIVALFLGLMRCVPRTVILTLLLLSGTAGISGEKCSVRDVVARSGTDATFHVCGCSFGDLSWVHDVDSSNRFVGKTLYSKSSDRLRPGVSVVNDTINQCVNFNADGVNDSMAGRHCFYNSNQGINDVGTCANLSVSPEAVPESYDKLAVICVKYSVFDNLNKENLNDDPCANLSVLQEAVTEIYGDKLPMVYSELGNWSIANISCVSFDSRRKCEVFDVCFRGENTANFCDAVNSVKLKMDDKCFGKHHTIDVSGLPNSTSCNFEKSSEMSIGWKIGNHCRCSFVCYPRCNFRLFM
jgi:hypothetical protein